MVDWCQNKGYVGNIKLALGRKWEAGRVAHACNPNIWETEGGGFCEFKASLSYRRHCLKRSGEGLTFEGGKNPILVVV